MAPYPAYPVPADEDQRLRELERYGILDADSDEHFDRILDLTAALFQTPIVASPWWRPIGSGSWPSGESRCAKPPGRWPSVPTPSSTTR